MKTIHLILTLILFSTYSHSQTVVKELKKKNFGSYQGEIPSYQYTSDTMVVQVEQTPITINVTENAVSITIGRLNKKGIYYILFKGKDYYVIDAIFEEDILTERLIISEKNKTIVREGSYPQPNATLKKTKK